ncbi:hypothetical protein PWR66_05445 [Paraburkholderia sp. A1RO-5]|uniref:hypothetical protein n=1 Tax=Paraburkholderia sp. A1RO-5 TaxID=3028369 RepID=UPI003B7CD890
MKFSWRFAPVFGVMTFVAVPALANVPFFFGAASLKFSAWWAIVLTLPFEAIVLRFVFRMGWLQAAKASIVINAVSALAGLFLYFPIGMLLYPILSPIVVPWTSQMTWEMGNTVEAALTLAGMAVVDTAVESVTLKIGFSTPLSIGRVSALLLANSVGVAAIFYTGSPEIFHSVKNPEVATLERHYAPEIALMNKIAIELPQHMRLNWLGELKIMDYEWETDITQQAVAGRFARIWIEKPTVIYFRSVESIPNFPAATARSTVGLATITRYGKKGSSLSWYEYTIQRDSSLGAVRVSAIFSGNMEYP